jgi:hypothetical protein
MYAGLKAKDAPSKALWCAASLLGRQLHLELGDSTLTALPRKRDFGNSRISAMNNQDFAPRDRDDLKGALRDYSEAICCGLRPVSQRVSFATSN